MKKILLLLILFGSFSVWAEAKEVLQQRLDKIEGFSANFIQTVKSPDNQVIQQGTGEIFLKRPNYFNWTTKTPEETILISDNENLWMYTPSLEQVTVTKLKQAVDNHLLLLISDSHNAVWNDYNVTRQQDTFTLIPTQSSNQQFIIRILPTGILSSLKIIESDGQYSDYDFSKQKLGDIKMSHFKFILPDGVTVDDQR